MLQQHLPFTVLKRIQSSKKFLRDCSVATAPTVYGIETPRPGPILILCFLALQQHLPFTVLKPWKPWPSTISSLIVATAPTVYGIETRITCAKAQTILLCCNSTYRLRYAPKGARQQRSKATMRSAHLKYLNEVKVKQKWWGNSTYCLRYWNSNAIKAYFLKSLELQLCLPFSVLKQLHIVQCIF